MSASFPSSSTLMKNKALHCPPTSQGSLPYDSLIEILSRLPAKSLIKFRCVSKSWHSLIGDKIHNKKLPPAMLGLFNKDNVKDFTSLKSRTYIDPSTVDTALSFIPSPPSPSSSSLRIADCCNGLLLFKDANFDSLQLYICNPATRMWAQIPNPPSSDHKYFALAFDSSRGSRYKILSFNDSDLMDSLFSSETGEWRKFEPTLEQADLDPPDLNQADDLDQADDIDQPDDFGLHLTGPDFTFLNGILFMVTSWWPCVVAVDLERDLCTRIGWPEAEEITSFQYYECIGHSGGLLHLAFIVEQDLRVFVLQDYPRGGRFILKHEVSTYAIMNKLMDDCCDLQPPDFSVIAFHQDLDLIFLRFEWKHIISYHLVSGEVEEVDNIHNCYHPYSQWVTYTPCY